MFKKYIDKNYKICVKNLTSSNFVDRLSSQCYLGYLKDSLVTNKINYHLNYSCYGNFLYFKDLHFTENLNFWTDYYESESVNTLHLENCIFDKPITIGGVNKLYIKNCTFKSSLVIKADYLDFDSGSELVFENNLVLKKLCLSGYFNKEVNFGNSEINYLKLSFCRIFSKQFNFSESRGLKKIHSLKKLNTLCLQGTETLEEIVDFNKIDNFIIDLHEADFPHLFKKVNQLYLRDIWTKIEKIPSGIQIGSWQIFKDSYQLYQYTAFSKGMRPFYLKVPKEYKLQNHTSEELKHKIVYV